nr:hypothetical protein [Tanacetum cinerariifolium]
MKERKVTAIKEIEHRLKESEMQTQDSLVTEGAALAASLVTVAVQAIKCSRSGNENKSFDNESNGSGNDADADIRPSYDSDIVSKVNREAQQANALLTNELERYKEKEKHFAKETTIECEYCKKIKLLNDEISNLKSQTCQNVKTFTRKNGKYDEYVQPLLKRKNELEKKNQELLKQINDLDNELRKARQTDQTLRMLLLKEENVKTGKQSLGFENKNDVETQVY